MEDNTNIFNQKNHFKLICILINILNLFKCEDSYIDVKWISSIPLSNYYGYQSLSLTSVNIPEATLEAVWDIQSVSSLGHCAQTDVQIYIQYGSYPLVAPYNETYPDNFYLNRTELDHFVVKTNNLSHTHDVLSPYAGVWFMAAFLPKGDDKLAVSGLNGKKCSYAASLRLISKVLTEIEQLDTSVQTGVTINSSIIFGRMFKFAVPLHTTDIQLKIENCNTLKYSENGTEFWDTSSYCPITVSISSKRLPKKGSGGDPHVNCENLVAGCILNVSKSAVGEIHYLRVDLQEQFNSSVQFEASFSIEECNHQPMFTKELRKKMQKNKITKTILNSTNIEEFDTPNLYISCFQPNATSAQSYHENNTLENSTYTQPNCDNITLINSIDTRNNVFSSKPQCVMLPSMGELSLAAKDFNTVYRFPDVFLFPQERNRIFVPDALVLVSTFEINAVRDSGGTLSLAIEVIYEDIDPSQGSIVSFCVMKDSIPGPSTVKDCPGGILQTVNTSDPEKRKSHIFLPYPEQANWYLGLNSQCFAANDSSVTEVCKLLPLVNLGVELTQCVDNECGTYGSCQAYISGLYVYSACKCIAGWRGYGCTDGTEADSDSLLLTSTLLLTLSNLFFIPGIILSIYRRYFVEALVYTFNMFFSTFYHACDNSQYIHKYCMMSYNILSFCDFFGSILSFYVTILAMSKLNSQVRSFLHMFGTLAISFLVQHNKHGLWAFLAPVLFSVSILVASWVRQCAKRKECYPSKWRYLKFLLPGLLLAGTGLIIYAFLETDSNYKYTHSVWHVVISLCIIFLLPTRRKNSVSKTYLELQQRSQETLADRNSDDSDLLTDLNSRRDSPDNLVL